MSAADWHANQSRGNSYKKDRLNQEKTLQSIADLKSQAVIADLLDPPARRAVPSSEAAGESSAPVPVGESDEMVDTSQGEGRTADATPQSSAPLDPRVSFKVEKLAQGLDVFREAVRLTQKITEDGTYQMRDGAAKVKAAIDEVVKETSDAERPIVSAGKIGNYILCVLCS